MEKKIDARGLACPQPVILTRKAMDEGAETLFVTVDNTAAVENLKRLADSRGYAAAVSGGEGNFLLVMDRGDAPETPAPAETEPVCRPAGAKTWAVFLGKDTVGAGDETLGKNLMRMYLYTLAQGEEVPGAIIFMNGGVKVPTLDEQAAEHLNTLERKGTRVLVCGTCLNFYGLSDQLKAGAVSNMYEIAEALGAADKVVSL